MSLTGAILGGAAIGGVSSLLGSRSARKSADRARRESRRQYNQTREDYAPFREAGYNALSELQALMNSPNYQNYGVNALDRSAAARGLYGSTGHYSDINRWASQDHMNRLGALAGMGQTATNSLSTFGANNAANMGNLMQSAGNARASGYLGVGNALNNALNQYMLGQGSGHINPQINSLGDLSAYFSGSRGLPQSRIY